MNCEICANTFTSYVREPIKCEYCEFVACKTCCSTYLLSINVPGCMNLECKGEWSKQFISDKFTKVFATTKLREHRSEVLYQEQQSLMPEAQLSCEADEKQRLLRKNLVALRNKMIRLNESIYHDKLLLRTALTDLEAEAEDVRHSIRKWGAKIHVIRSNNVVDAKTEKAKATLITKMNEANETLQKMNESIDELKIKHREDVLKLEEDTIATERNLIETQIIDIEHEMILKTGVPRTQFVKKCSDAECRGFLSTRWKCGMCNKWTCPDCHEIKQEEKEHVCDPNNVATAKLLALDTKNCPKCQTGIFKIDGCDQMWCTQCHTAFSWKTGQIENKIHNPHYYAWRRQNGGLAREPGDVACGNEMNHNLALMIKYAIMQRHHLDNGLSGMIDDIVQNSMHIRHAIMPYLRSRYEQYNNINNNETFAMKTLNLRKQYLRKQRTLEDFKHTIERFDTDLSKYTDFRHVLDLLVTTVTEILYRFKANLEATSDDNYDRTILQEINEIVDYTNSCCMNIGVIYSLSSTYSFNGVLAVRSIKPIKPKRICAPKKV
jgi:hypothetical protein